MQALESAGVDVIVATGENEAAVRACLRNGWFSILAASRDLAVHEVDPDALVAQDARAAAGGLGRRVVGGDHHARDPGGEDGVRARRRAALVAARLERDVHGRARPCRPAAASSAMTSACLAPEAG